MIPLQEKLNVSVKTKSNIFNWRGQFTPQFVDYIIDCYVLPNQIILDPFSGSGTVLLEASRRGISAYGYEINPAAYIMSRFFTLCNLSFDRRIELLNSVETKINESHSLFSGLPVHVDNKDYRKSFENLINLCKFLINKVTDKNERILLLNMFFISEKHKNLEIINSINKSFSYIKKQLLETPYSKKKIFAKLNDARSVGEFLPEMVDVIFTSPPYINVFNYHQNYRAIIEILGFDVLKLAESEFGSNRKNRGNRFKTVVQYCIDMEQSIYSFWKTLKPFGTMILVIGRESNVKKTPFFNGKMILDLINKMGCFSNPQILERKFINKFGINIKEDIINVLI